MFFQPFELWLVFDMVSQPMILFCFGYEYSDIAVFDKDGYATVVGRKKDMIIRGGENIYPAEVEQFLYTHPKIADVQV